MSRYKPALRIATFMLHYLLGGGAVPFFDGDGGLGGVAQPFSLDFYFAGWRLYAYGRW